jgi:hypothetical protein
LGGTFLKAAFRLARTSSAVDRLASGAFKLDSPVKAKDCIILSSAALVLTSSHPACGAQSWKMRKKSPRRRPYSSVVDPGVAYSRRWMVELVDSVCPPALQSFGRSDWFNGSRGQDNRPDARIHRAKLSHRRIALQSQQPAPDRLPTTAQLLGCPAASVTLSWCHTHPRLTPLRGRQPSFSANSRPTEPYQQ